MNLFYPLVGLILLAIIIFGPQLNETAAKIYWRRNHRKQSCYEQARFLYTLIRYYRISPAAYTAVRADRLKIYLQQYVTYMYPCDRKEKQMQTNMLELWYQLKEQKAV